MREQNTEKGCWGNNLKRANNPLVEMKYKLKIETLV